MAQSVKNLLGKHENQSSTPSTQVRKLGVVTRSYNPITEKTDPASLALIGQLAWYNQQAPGPIERS